jgi:hypothetical protein
VLRFLFINRAARLARILGRKALRLSHNSATQMLYNQVADPLNTLKIYFKRLNYFRFRVRQCEIPCAARVAESHFPALSVTWITTAHCTASTTASEPRHYAIAWRAVSHPKANQQLSCLRLIIVVC